MSLVQSLPSQVSIAVPRPTTPLTMTIVLPELRNPFYAALASLLHPAVYKSIGGETNPDIGQTGDFIKPQMGAVAVQGTAVPGDVVAVTVNGINQNAGSVVADSGGNWSTTVVLGPGASTVAVVG